MRPLDNYDLHNHSTCSDGLLTPTQLIELAVRTGANPIALTDHDTVDGLAEARLAAESSGTVLINGVEISVSWGDTTLHIVGLDIDPAAGELAAGLRGIRAGRIERGRKIAAALDRLGIEGTFEGAHALAKNKTMLGRTHFARHLLERGAVKNMQAAFDRYLVKGKPAYVAHQWAGLEEAVAWIRAANGVAVLAHPGRYKLGRDEMRELLGRFKDLGGAAIEVVTGSHTREHYATYRKLAMEFGLAASRGSDYHGPGESSCEPGRLPQLHESLTPVWSLWAH
jgi:predicted metal-dependent phosphoesterase TrpH